MIVIPMAGLSRRFTDAGYGAPKYMLPLGDSTVFAHAIASFRNYADTLPFLFIARDVSGTRAFIESECVALGLREARIVILAEPTAGQADTVDLGLRAAKVADSAPITIFNIDTFRPGFTFPHEAWSARSDGFLEVFRGTGANGSYVRPADGEEPLAAETAETRPISDLCCTGLYHFARAGDFRIALALERRRQQAGELSVAPLYNHLIRRGQPIHYRLVPERDVVFCGAPSDYEALGQAARARA